VQAPAGLGHHGARAGRQVRDQIRRHERHVAGDHDDRAAGALERLEDPGQRMALGA
jgi:hypothetical protein